jgi:ribosomal-protein-alanine N-acetyltransferase
LSALELPTLRTERLLLRSAALADAAAFAALHRDNAAFFAPWDPPRPEGWSTEAFWRELIARSLDDQARGVGARVALFARRDGDGEGALVGTIGVSAIERGPFQNARIGCKLDADAEGRGLMREALEALLDHCFGPLELHRVEANHLPSNARSAALLERLGFEAHGVAPAYLRIGPEGAFRDHVLRSVRAEIWWQRRARAGG